MEVRRHAGAPLSEVRPGGDGWSSGDKWGAASAASRVLQPLQMLRTEKRAVEFGVRGFLLAREGGEASRGPLVRLALGGVTGASDAIPSSLALWRGSENGCRG